jgi:S-adenosylmethionine decarboxylase
MSPSLDLGSKAAPERLPTGAVPPVAIQQVSLHLGGVESVLLEGNRPVKRLADLCTRLGATVVAQFVYEFGPGLTAVVILSESHAALHTWPELGYAHLDLVTCGSRIQMTRVVPLVTELFEPSELFGDIPQHGEFLAKWGAVSSATQR